MSPKIDEYEVDSVETMESAITDLIRKEYVVANKTARSATLVLRKEPFNAVAALIFFWLLIIPGVIYCVAYGRQRDHIIELTVNRELLEEPDADALIHLDALRAEGFVRDEEFARIRERIEPR